MRLFLTFIFSLFLISVTLGQQELVFGKVVLSDVVDNTNDDFPEANALVLKRSVVAQLGDFVEVEERIKVINADGFKNATVRIPYPSVSKVEGATYNVVNGALEKTPLDKGLVFTDEEIEGYNFKKFTFPKVAVGSILEYKYKTYKNTISDIDIQSDIPTLSLRVEVRNYSQGNFRILQNPRAYINVSRIEDGRRTIINAKNIAALEKESFVPDMELFRSKIELKLSGIGSQLDLNSWEQFPKLFYRTQSWYGNLKPSGIYKDDLNELLEGEKTQLDKAKKIYNLLHTKFEWNKRYGLFPSESVRTTFKKKEGNVADINMLLISMLRSIDIQAYPVLSSTKSNGIPLTASVEAFNYLLVSAIIDGKSYILDAAHDKASFDRLPTVALNWQGYLIREDEKSTWLDLTKTPPSVKTKMITVGIDEDLIMEGQARERLTGYFSLDLKRDLKDQGEMNKSDMVSYDYKDMDVSDVEIDAIETGERADLSYVFDIEDAVDEVNDKLYVTPLLYLALQENPFTKEDRKFPIDFNFPQKEKIVLNINYPESYAVESLPESIRMMLPNNYGAFVYQISDTGQTIQISASLDLNVALFSADQYGDLKSFYKAILDKENEKIVFVKS